MAEPEAAPIAAWLDQRLFESRTKIADLSRAIGVAGATISRWKLGQSKPEPHNVRKLAEYFAVPYSYLMELAGYPTEDEEPQGDQDIAFSGLLSLSPERRKEVDRLIELLKREQEDERRQQPPE